LWAPQLRDDVSIHPACSAQEKFAYLHRKLHRVAGSGKRKKIDFQLDTGNTVKSGSLFLKKFIRIMRINAKRTKISANFGHADGGFCTDSRYQ
jgi:hypothetical protein